MNLFLTKESIKSFDIKEIKSPEELGEVTLFDWAGKVFYVNEVRCLQVMNVKTRTFFLFFDVKEEDLKKLHKKIFLALAALFILEPEILKYIAEREKEIKEIKFGTLKNRGVSLAMGNAEKYFLDNEPRLRRASQDSKKTMKLNMDINFERVFTKQENGKRISFYGYEKFGEEVKKLLQNNFK